MNKHDNFLEAFSVPVGSCRGQCACGKEFYNPDDCWSWSEGELRALEKDSNTTSIDRAVSYIKFEGVEYVADCTCWHERSKKLMTFIDAHDSQIVAYLKTEKARKLADANRLDFGGIEG